jgi:UPF0042 nucleotide-binding protein
MENAEQLKVLVVTGMSGSGKSLVMDVLEDIGFYCIDNLPPQLIGKFVEICRGSADRLKKIAIAADLRSGEMFADAYRVLREMERQPEYDVKILYIEAEDEVLIKRYKETRRRHPLDDRFSGNLHLALSYEREQLSRVKGIADYCLETSYCSASQLKAQVREIFLDNQSDSMSIKVTSFGFKYGVSTESDLVFDVRCLPNPYYVEELRHHTGCETCVQNYVMSFQQSRELFDKIADLLDFLIPLYVQEGKSRLVVSFGCTGGKHRSITFAEKMGEYLTSKGMHIMKQHRDIGKDMP